MITSCPQCAKPFSAPALTGASVDSAPPPAPPTTAAVESHRGTAPPRVPDTVRDPAPQPQSRGFTGSSTWTLRKDIVRWLAPVALFLAFVLSFFTWLAVAPNGRAIYTQNGWQAMTGGVQKVDFAGEEVLRKEQALRDAGGMNAWLLLYLILLILAMLLAIADLVISLMDLIVPDAFRTIWPHRGLILVAVTALLLLSLLAPMMSGFGLESTAVTLAEKDVPPMTAKLDGTAVSPNDVQMRDVRRDVAVASLGVQRSRWLGLVFLMTSIALIGAALSLWLDRRGSEPEPRMDFYC
jgi:hypothetical protein